ncbi:MAG TPA: hypothetical protein VF033_11640 [Steroidobacteraceae bacterium]
MKRGLIAVALLWSCGVVAGTPESSTFSEEFHATTQVAALPAPVSPDAASLAEGYFALGTWRIGMPRDQAVKLFTDMTPIEGATSYRATAHTHFAQDLPTELTFADGKLESVKLQIYQGTDFDAAVQRMQAALLYMNEHFGGANFEGGLKTWKDPRGELLGPVLKQTIQSMEDGVRAAYEKNSKKKKKSRKHPPTTHVAFAMVMNFRTEVTTTGNFLLGEFRYVSNLKEYTISLYDDREFIPARIPDATIMLFPAEGERPALGPPAAQ